MNARPGRFGRWFVGLVVVVLAGMLGQAVAQERGDAADGRSDLRQLKSRLEQRFQVMRLRGGLVLVPREATRSFNNIELADDGVILLDGTAVTGRELRARVPDADMVMRLSYLDAETRRSLFASANRPIAAEPTPRPDAPSPPQPPAAAVAPAPPAPPRPADGWVERERYRRGGARVRLGGDVWVKEGEAAGDAVVAIFGTARVDGRVDGDVVAVGGSVVLGPHADVRGNAVAVGGSVERDPGARVDGDVSEVRISAPAFGPLIRIRPRQDWRWFASPFGASTDLFVSLLRMSLVGLLAALTVAIARTPVRRVSRVITAEPWRAALAGLAAQIFFVPVLVITVVVLAVSIIGIPLLLLVPFGLLAALFALVLGFTGAGCAVGDVVGRWSGKHGQNLLVSLVIGLAVLWALTVIARFVGLAGGPVRVILSVALAAGFVIEYVAWTVGLGAVVLSRFGRRDPRSYVPPAPAGFDPEPPPALDPMS